MATCEHCGTEVHGQYHRSVIRPFEEGDVYHSVARCRDTVKAQRDEAVKRAGAERVRGDNLQRQLQQLADRMPPFPAR